MNTLLTYYGGKQTMARHIVPLFDATRDAFPTYVEPFAGGLAILFAKQKHKAEVISDINHMVFNFWETVRTHPDELAELIRGRDLLSASYHSLANKIYHGRREATPLEKAWAFWYSTNSSMNHLTGATALTTRPKQPQYFRSKVDLFDVTKHRMRSVLVLNFDALRVISLYDAPGTVFYLDPPYVGTEQGHYGGYSEQEFTRLLRVLPLLKGRFVLSHFKRSDLSALAMQYGWQCLYVDRHISANNVNPNGNMVKTEMIVHNLPVAA